MIVEVTGTGVHNKGAELMLLAIQEYLRQNASHVRIAVSHWFGPYEMRGRYGLRTKVVHDQPLKRAFLNYALPSTFRSINGIVVDRDIDAVLDASGFAYGDAWGVRPVNALLRHVTRSQKLGRPHVLLPQALGPFENGDIARAFAEVAKMATTIYARDRQSLRYVQNLSGGPFGNVKQAPDFTNLIKGHVPEDLDLPERFACLVPNERMLTDTNRSVGAAYIDFLAHTVCELEKAEVEPVILIHAPAGDRRVAEELNSTLGHSLRLLSEDDPVALKGIIGQAVLVIGSRFHALVGALSQGVPALATSWSHKYEELFEDYGCPQYVVSPTMKSEAVAQIVRDLCDSSNQETLRTTLAERAEAERARARGMFAETAAALNLGTATV